MAGHWRCNLSDYPLISLQEILDDHWNISTEAFKHLEALEGILRIRNSARPKRKFKTGDLLVGVSLSNSSVGGFRIAVVAAELTVGGYISSSDTVHAIEDVAWFRMCF